MFSLIHFYGSHLVYIAVILFSLWHPRYCRAQGNNPCQTYATCGEFGVCDSRESPICSCLRGFYPLNNEEWSSGNWSGGCVRRLPLNCDGGHKQDEFYNLQVLMMVSDFRDGWSGPESECEGRCLSNCWCLGYSIDRDGEGCRFWRSLIDIQKFPSGSGSHLYIRVSNFELDHKNGSKEIIVILVLVGFVALSNCAYFLQKWIAKSRSKTTTVELVETSTCVPFDPSLHLQEAIAQGNLQEPPLFKFEILANATNNFSEANKLGKGGFGPVYKGELVNGREIAVKRLSLASGQGMQEFTNEVVLISKVQHKNLVTLLGCCVDNKETMLIYEYMPNKSLDFFLFDTSQEILDWSKRLNIIEGVCRGLLYLHRDSRLKIIHRDLKPSNILLDNDWNPKISDFGIARIYETQQDHVCTQTVVGTYGYMAPEYAIKGRFSEKSDVFSFGVLVLEIATGRRNTSFRHQDGCLNLLGHVWKLWNEDSVEPLIDPRISGPGFRAEVTRCIQIGLLCVQEFAIDRPSISAVLSMLNTEIVELPDPKQSAFAINSSCSNTGSTSSQQSENRNSSVNNVTLSTVVAR